jgi:4-hydroxy-tetrahydrodipicolinate reductase
MHKIKLSILGCSGKTGKKILDHASMNENFQLGNCLVSANSQFLNQDLFEIIKGNAKKINAIATNNLDEIIKNSDMIIDFSVLGITNELMSSDIKNKKIIIGVTNISEELQIKIKKKSENNVIFQSSNMSIGVALINNFLKTNREIINSQYNLIITDIHHKNKKDAPSGTAKSFQESLGGKKDIDIHSSRVGDINGIHEILMISDDEFIKISHESLNRDIFAIGTLKIAIWLDKVSENRLYGMEDFLVSKANL